MLVLSLIILLLFTIMHFSIKKPVSNFPVSIPTNTPVSTPVSNFPVNIPTNTPFSPVSVPAANQINVSDLASFNKDIIDAHNYFRNRDYGTDEYNLVYNHTILQALKYLIFYL